MRMFQLSGLYFSHDQSFKFEAHQNLLRNLWKLKTPGLSIFSQNLLVTLIHRRVWEQCSKNQGKQHQVLGKPRLRGVGTYVNTRTSCGAQGELRCSGKRGCTFAIQQDGAKQMLTGHPRNHLTTLNPNTPPILHRSIRECGHRTPMSSLGRNQPYYDTLPL